jgi:hypothetical protein
MGLAGDVRPMRSLVRGDGGVMPGGGVREGGVSFPPLLTCALCRSFSSPDQKISTKGNQGSLPAQPF